MSNETQTTELPCEQLPCGETISQLIFPKDKDIGGFMVRRALPSAHLKKVGPWVFFDHMGPAQFDTEHGLNVRPHPHIGIATVTYLFEGEILHRDSLGTEQAIQPGDINLMVAGRGIVHSERERPERARQPRTVHALQLWLALPEAMEDIEPAFYHYPKTTIPLLNRDGVTIRVMMGEAFGMQSPVKCFYDTLYLEADIPAGHTFPLPVTEEKALYVVQGDVTLGNEAIPEHGFAVLPGASQCSVQAATNARVALVGGAAISRRFIEWNFVSSQKEKIEQAKQDWQARRYPVVPGDEEEFIPLPG
ncbi:pirin family protein [Photobacterium atrarenae]|uniref:Pirin family protein n=1 Tax=Photobacterium atrarenae TaxID=865757 RepID=A0ABY5GLN6_9GAMM|nr:pirin family protein [Photobacterium atrarenae]UTV29650.1 pirin family protein [Photobacterium atrarenae]